MGFAMDALEGVSFLGGNFTCGSEFGFGVRAGDFDLFTPCGEVERLLDGGMYRYVPILRGFWGFNLFNRASNTSERLYFLAMLLRVSPFRTR